MESSFYNDFISLGLPESLFTCHNAKLSVNKIKNRYTTILPCMYLFYSDNQFNMLYSIRWSYSCSTWNQLLIYWIRLYQCFFYTCKYWCMWWCVYHSVQLKGYTKPCEYIATQGPLPSTFGDFWRMIWERKCSTIVMLTNLCESGKVSNKIHAVYWMLLLQIKCHQYWPSYGSAVYGAYRVTLKSVEPLVEYTIRVFEVENVLNIIATVIY